VLVNFKYNVGQEVYYLGQGMIRIKVECVNCDSTGELELLRGGKAPCNICQGYGELEKPRSKYTVFGPKTIVGLHYDTLPSYLFNVPAFFPGVIDTVRYDEKDVFATKGEAEAECLRRNNLLGHKPKLGLVKADDKPIDAEA
jgi:hypothetical protein